MVSDEKELPLPTEVIDYVVALVVANGRQIRGKTRLQKTAYLLEAMNLGIGLDFDYHHYGPFSPELAYAADDASDFGYLKPETAHGYHRVPYTIYKASDAARQGFADGRDAERTRALNALRGHSAIVLELASTADYLRRYEDFDDPWPEVRIRKTLKATDDRIQAAKDLLKALNLPA